jgi:CheY-like chemotaxis protein
LIGDADEERIEALQSISHLRKVRKAIMKGRILIIDDDKEFCSFLACVFEQDGYAVETARNGNEGLAKARAAQFDLIITDMIMPELDGAELIARLRLDGNEVPIIGITAYSPSEAKLQAAEFFRVTTMINKPFSLAEIREAVETALLKVEKLQD